MTRFPIGLIVLVVVSALIYFGLAHRVLDRMRLTDKAALAIIAAIIVGSFIDIPLPVAGANVSVNVGGALVPLGLAGYLIAKAGTTMEKTRSVGAAIVTAVAIYVVWALIMRGLPEPAGRFAVLDMIYFVPLVAGAAAYIAGRSRRASFVAAVLGVLLVDVFYYAWIITTGAPANTPIAIGGAGAFDVMILSAFFAVLLAEVVGEVRERLQGGPQTEDRPQKLVERLKNVNLTNMFGLGGDVKKEKRDGEDK